MNKVSSELKSNKLIEILNPEMRKGRLYRLIDKCNEIVKNIE